MQKRRRTWFRHNRALIEWVLFAVAAAAVEDDEDTVADDDDDDDDEDTVDEEEDDDDDDVEAVVELLELLKNDIAYDDML